MDNPKITLQDGEVLFSADIQNHEVRLVVEEVWSGDTQLRTRLKIIERHWAPTYSAIRDVIRYYAAEEEEAAWDDLNATLKRTMDAQLTSRRHTA
ncbi:hypothetical protein MWH03_00265 [Klebsiella pneumoniae]|nr:hypothetical protein [Klebsiella pneumoniae]